MAFRLFRSPEAIASLYRLFLLMGIVVFLASRSLKVISISAGDTITCYLPGLMVLCLPAKPAIMLRPFLSANVRDFLAYGEGVSVSSFLLDLGDDPCLAGNSSALRSTSALISSLLLRLDFFISRISMFVFRISKFYLFFTTLFPRFRASVNS